MSARFQPYRLENSKCWRQGYARLTCIACHNPHEQLVQSAASYDKKCLACHKTTVGDKTTVGKKTMPGKTAQGDPGDPGAVCPVGTKNCVTCHMPKVEAVGIHASFIDHEIRIVRPGERYPN